MMIIILILKELKKLTLLHHQITEFDSLCTDKQSGNHISQSNFVQKSCSEFLFRKLFRNVFRKSVEKSPQKH